MPLDPIPGLLQRRGDEPAVMNPTDFPALNQARPLQHLQVLGNRRRRNRVRLAKPGHRARTTAQPGDDPAPDGIRQRSEDAVEWLHIAGRGAATLRAGAAVVVHADVAGAATMSHFKPEAACMTSVFSRSATPSVSSVAAMWPIVLSHSRSVMPKPS